MLTIFLQSIQKSRNTLLWANYIGVARISLPDPCFLFQVLGLSPFHFIIIFIITIITIIIIIITIITLSFYLFLCFKLVYTNIFLFSCRYIYWGFSIRSCSQFFST